MYLQKCYQNVLSIAYSEVNSSNSTYMRSTTKCYHVYIFLFPHWVEFWITLNCSTVVLSLNPFRPGSLATYGPFLDLEAAHNISTRSLLYFTFEWGSKTLPCQWVYCMHDTLFQCFFFSVCSYQALVRQPLPSVLLPKGHLFLLLWHRFWTICSV